jgi:hypothetical protein
VASLRRSRLWWSSGLPARERDGSRRSHRTDQLAFADLNGTQGIVADWPGPSFSAEQTVGLAAYALAGRRGAVPYWKSMPSHHMRCKMMVGQVHRYNFSA